jgi:hypothetical protein
MRYHNRVIPYFFTHLIHTGALHDKNLLLKPLFLKQELAIYPHKVSLSTQFHAKKKIPKA